MKVFVRCKHCGGEGRIELTGVYAETMKLVVRFPARNGAELARLAKCKATAMNNRLVALKRYGLIVGVKFGRQIRWDIA
jgi:hypothetical protein